MKAGTLAATFFIYALAGYVADYFGLVHSVLGFTLPLFTLSSEACSGVFCWAAINNFFLGAANIFLFIINFQLKIISLILWPAALTGISPIAVALIFTVLLMFGGVTIYQLIRSGSD